MRHPVAATARGASSCQSGPRMRVEPRLPAPAGPRRHLVPPSPPHTNISPRIAGPAGGRHVPRRMSRPAARPLAATAASSPASRSAGGPGRRGAATSRRVSAYLRVTPPPHTHVPRSPHARRFADGSPKAPPAAAPLLVASASASAAVQAKHGAQQAAAPPRPTPVLDSGGPVRCCASTDHPQRQALHVERRP